MLLKEIAKLNKNTTGDLGILKYHIGFGKKSRQFVYSIIDC